MESHLVRRRDWPKCISGYLQNIPSSWEKFDTAYVALEAYASPTPVDNGPLPSCNDLPASGSLTYYIESLWEATPAWNSETPSSAAWTGSFESTWTPKCGWGYSQGTAYGYPYKTLSFNP
jgi:hypothetical protein